MGVIMWELVVVWTIVGGVLLLLVRSLCLSLRGKGDNCSCSVGCSGCSKNLANNLVSNFPTVKE